MPVQTDLSISPYFDDFSDQRDYYKILFRPGVAVQTRELNQLQTMLQRQVERFGDNVFKQGTIIDGCNIAFHDDLKYIKIRDAQTDSKAVDVTTYEGYRLRNQNDILPLQAAIITYSAGFESTDPNLNTLYVRYLNTGFKTGGANTGQTSYEPNEMLTVYNPDAPIEKVAVTGGSSGFAVTDRVLFLSAITIQNSVGGTAFANNFYVGDYITDGTANVQITAIDSNSVGGSVVLKIAPSVESLKSGDATKWTFAANTNIQSSNTTAKSSIARIKSIIGYGAAATLTTSTLGEITSIDVTQKGIGYYILPNVSIISSGATSGQQAVFSAVAQNYLANITVAGAQYTPIGNSYAMTVDHGVIYQKGYFTRVDQQIVVVEKYSNLPDAKSVGFTTSEEIINSNQDTSLLDNAIGAPNHTAPGANRLKLTPTLSVLSKADADRRPDWLYIAEFSNGYPYKQNRQTVYNKVNQYVSQRVYETAGNYVSNPFLLNTKSANNLTNESASFNILIDPGSGFINGNKVETTFNYETSVDKGVDSKTATNGNISFNYGNYVNVNEYGGSFIFKNGDQVDLYNTAGKFITSGGAGGTPSPSTLGTKIGTARIRSIVFDSGVEGTPNCIYRLYLFDINMNSGQNFSSVKSIYYNGSVKAVCDTILEAGKAVVKDNILSQMLFYAGSPAVINTSAISYVYRTSNTYTLTTAGTITLSTTGGETYPYTGQLSTSQEREVIITPLSNTEFVANLTGTVTTATNSPILIGGGTSNFLTQLQVGDFIKIWNNSKYAQISSIANNTYATLTANAEITATANTFKLVFPANIPISMDRSARTITSANTQLTIDLATGGAATLTTAVSVSVAHNIRTGTLTPVTKSVSRNKYVRICMANNTSKSTGPWPMGVSDIFRLGGVYKGSNGTFGTSGTGVTDVTQYFYIDHNQTEDYYGIGYLYLRPNTIAIANTDWLLVKYDYFTHSGEGLKAPGDSGTYPIDDTITLENASATVNTIEIPEMYGARGDYYDLRDYFDLRPASVATVTPSATAATAPLNPTDQTTANRLSSNNKKFPSPDSELSATISYYQGRTDRVVVDELSQFRIIRGVPGSNTAPSEPVNSITINLLNIPPYPSLPYLLSANTIAYADTKIVSEKYANRRLNDYRIATPVSAGARTFMQPRGYTMADIGKLERRIADLEYYTSLSLTETIAQKRAMVGFDGTERFKFGFFVDGFEDYKYADTSNPHYSASIIDGYLSPLVIERNITTTTPDPVTEMPYIEVPYVSQSRATEEPPPVANNTSNTVTGNTVSSNTAANTSVVRQTITTVRQSMQSAAGADDASIYEDFFFTMSASAGPVVLVIDGDLDQGSSLYLRKTGVVVYQSMNTYDTGNVLKTSSSYVSATDDFIQTYNLTGYTTTQRYPVEQSSSTGPFSYWLTGRYGLLWNHAPNKGLYYKIRVYKGVSSYSSTEYTPYNNYYPNGQGGYYYQPGYGSRTQTFQVGGYNLILQYPVDSIVNETVNPTTTNYSLTYHGYVTNFGNHNHNSFFF